jgi:glyoxylate reductase
MAKLVVAVTRRLPAPVEARLRADYEARLNATDRPLSASEIVAAAQGADVLLPTVTDRIDAALVRALPASIRLIANFGAGLDHIDLAACAERNIPVANTPDVLTEDTADMAMALILAAARRLGEGERLVRAGAWGGWTPTFMIGRRVAGKRLGIVGMGRIGTALARRALGFGMAVHYHNRSRAPASLEAELRARFWPDLDAMLEAVDVVSIHCPRTKDTEGLFSTARLARLAPHAILVNTARGGIVDEAALAAALAEGRIAAAGLDVYDGEPAVNPALMALENVVLAPHLGSATEEGRVAMGERALANIAAFAEGRPLPDAVKGR